METIYMKRLQKRANELNLSSNFKLLEFINDRINNQKLFILTDKDRYFVGIIIDSKVGLYNVHNLNTARKNIEILKAGVLNNGLL